ncbi:50S ribosomal protein L36, partial [Paenibacillus sp. Y412MC10]
MDELITINLTPSLNPISQKSKLIPPKPNLILICQNPKHKQKQ